MNEYYGNDFEDAVVRVLPNGKRMLKFKSSIEREANPGNGVAEGRFETPLEPITKEEYDTFYNAWNYNDVNCRKVDMSGNPL